MRSNGSSVQPENNEAIGLNAPSVITLGFGPADVARFAKLGDDLIILLKDGRRVTTDVFFRNFDDGRNGTVFIEDNDVVWWAQYVEPWCEFDIAEIERDVLPAAFVLPGLSPLLVGLAAVGALGLVPSRLPNALAQTDDEEYEIQTRKLSL